MTAERWWVRGFARWVARIDAVQGHLNLFFTAMTGVSIASGALKYLGAPTWAIGSFIAVLAAGILLYTYLYSEGGVWNQVGRDKEDMSSNFAGPTAAIDDTLIAVGVYTAVHGEEPSDREIEEIHEAVRSAWFEFRDGMDLER